MIYPVRFRTTPPPLSAYITLLIFDSPRRFERDVGTTSSTTTGPPYATRTVNTIRARQLLYRRVNSGYRTEYRSSGRHNSGPTIRVRYGTFGINTAVVYATHINHREVSTNRTNNRTCVCVYGTVGSLTGDSSTFGKSTGRGMGRRFGSKITLRQVRGRVFHVVFDKRAR